MELIYLTLSMLKRIVVLLLFPLISYTQDSNKNLSNPVVGVISISLDAAHSDLNMYKLLVKKSNKIGDSPKLDAEWLIKSEQFFDRIYNYTTLSSFRNKSTGTLAGDKKKQILLNEAQRLYFGNKKSSRYKKFKSIVENLLVIIEDQVYVLRYYGNLNEDGPVDLFGEKIDNPNQEAFLDSYNKSLMKIKNNTLKMKFMWPNSFNSQYNYRLLYYFNLQQNLMEYKTAVDKALGQSD